MSMLFLTVERMGAILRNHGISESDIGVILMDCQEQTAPAVINGVATTEAGTEGEPSVRTPSGGSTSEAQDSKVGVVSREDFPTPSGGVLGAVTAHMVLAQKNRRVAHAYLMAGREAQISLTVPAARLSAREVCGLGALLKAFSAKVE
jgi:hypothetical protein